MLKITRVLQMAKSSLLLANPLFKPSRLLSTNVHLFSESSKNKIYQLLQEEKVMKNLNAIAQQIHSLEEPEKLQVFGAMLQKIIQGQLPSKIIQNHSINELLKKYPEPYFDVNYHRIQQNMDGLEEYMESDETKVKKMLAKQISDSFLLCFDVLKKIEAKNASPREIQLLRTFALYNFKYLSQLVQPSKYKEVINKSKECYKLILSKISSILKKFDQEELKLKNQSDPNPKEEQKEMIENQYKVLQQTRLMLIEEYSEVVEQMMSNEQELQEQRKERLSEKKGRTAKNQEPNEQQQFQFSKQALVFEPYIEKAVKNYTIIPHIYLQSEYLYKLKKMLVEIRNQKEMRSVLVSRKSQEEKSAALKQIQQKLRNDYEQLYEEGCNALKDTQKQQKLSEQELSEFIMSMFTTRIHRFAEEASNNQKVQLAKIFGEEIQKLVNFIPNEPLRKKVLVSLVKEIKETLGLKIDNYVQKMPRNIRSQRRNRNQSDL